MAGVDVGPFQTLTGVGWPNGLLIPFLIRVEISDIVNLAGAPPAYHYMQHWWFHFGTAPPVETKHVRLSVRKRRSTSGAVWEDNRRFSEVDAANSSNASWAAWTVTDYPSGWPPFTGDDWLWPTLIAGNQLRFFSVGTALDDTTVPFTAGEADRVPLADARADWVTAGSPATGALPVALGTSSLPTLRTTLPGAGASGADILLSWNNESLTVP
jgi:hypothetical protein